MKLLLHYLRYTKAKRYSCKVGTECMYIGSLTCIFSLEIGAIFFQTAGRNYYNSLHMVEVYFYDGRSFLNYKEC